MAKGNNKGRVRSVVFIALALVLITGLAILLTRLISCNNGQYDSFYVTRNGTIYAPKDQAWQFPGETLTYNVNYSGGDNRLPKGYSVKVVSNATDETDFSYAVDGNAHRYGKENLDLTTAFDIELNAASFTLTMPYSMQEVLQSLYPDNTVTVSDDVDLKAQPYFIIVVTAYDEKARVELYLTEAEFGLGDNLLFY